MTATGVTRPQGVTVRSAARADHQEVLGLLEGAGLPTTGVPPTLQDFYVAEREGRIIGAIGLELYGTDALLRSAVVEHGTRSAGLGTALVERILHHAHERDVQAVFLLTTTAESYFPRFGFDRITRDEVPGAVKASVEFREACPASAVVMRRVLEPVRP